MTDTSLAALLLTNRIVDVGSKPLTAGEFWTLCERVQGDLAALQGMSAEQIAATVDVSPEDGDRYAALLAAGTAFSFERERLEEEGIRLLSALDDEFPERLRARLGSACPSFLLVAGPLDHLSVPLLGVVGSRDAAPAALDVAAAAAHTAVGAGRGVVGGLAGGIDQASMSAAFDAHGRVVGVPAEGLRIAGRTPETRRRVHDGHLCMASPYGPAARFTAGNAMGRNKVVYGLADVTLVVCSDAGSGGTWEGAKEATRRRFGRVAVWSGEGEGAGNQQLIADGAAKVTAVTQLLELEPDVPVPPGRQASLFD